MSALAAKAKVERAIAERYEAAGAAGHKDLVSTEWRLRQAERSMG